MKTTQKTPRKRGRPPLKNPLVARSGIRSTPREKASWIRAARRAGQDLSAWLRELANQSS